MIPMGYAQGGAPSPGSLLDQRDLRGSRSGPAHNRGDRRLGDTAGYVMTPTQAASVGEAVAAGVDVNGDGFSSRAVHRPHPLWVASRRRGHLHGLPVLALPVSNTGPATAVRAHGATLAGSVTPSAVTHQAAGTQTTFQISARSDHGLRLASARRPRCRRRQGSRSAPCQTTVQRLAPNKKYHYRLTEQCADGAWRLGADRSFTTARRPHRGSRYT
jgi:hypothetical protein